MKYEVGSTQAMTFDWDEKDNPRMQRLQVVEGTDFLVFAKKFIGADLDLLTVRLDMSGHFGQTLVMAVDEWGYRKEDMRFNRQAWSVSGRSAIVGPAIVWADGGESFTPESLEFLEAPIPADRLERMRAFASGPLCPIDFRRW